LGNFTGLTAAKPYINKRWWWLCFI
jgi:hypothetical protein